MEEIKELGEKLKLEEDRHEALRDKIVDLRGDVIDFEASEEYNEYKEMDDVEKQIKYSKQHGIFKQIEDIENLKDDVLKKREEIAKDLYVYVVAGINREEKNLEKYNSALKVLQRAVEKLETQINELKNSEEYKKGDADIIDTVSKLEQELTDKKQKLENLVQKIDTLKKELETLKEQKEKLEDEYGLGEPLQATTEETEKVVEEKSKEDTVNMPGSIEEKLQANKNTLDVVNKEIINLKRDIKRLKSSENYKKGDKETIAKVEALEAELESKNSVKEKISSRIDEYQKQLQVEEPKETEQQEAEPSNEEVKNETADKSNEDENKDKKDDAPDKGKNINRNSRGATKVQYVPVDKENDKDSEEMLREDFVMLYNKARKETLNTKEFNRLSEIMRDPDNYEKLNITTGIIFNKAKVLFNAMARTANATDITLKTDDFVIDEKIKQAEAIVSRDRETLNEEEQFEWDRAQNKINQYKALKRAKNTYSEVAKARVKHRWSGIFVFEDSSKTALPEAPKTKGLSEELAKSVVKDEEYKIEPKGEIAKTERTKEEVTTNEDRGSNWWI